MSHAGRLTVSPGNHAPGSEAWEVWTGNRGLRQSFGARLHGLDDARLGSGREDIHE